MTAAPTAMSDTDASRPVRRPRVSVIRPITYDPSGRTTKPTANTTYAPSTRVTGSPPGNTCPAKYGASRAYIVQSSDSTKIPAVLATTTRARRTRAIAASPWLAPADPAPRRTRRNVSWWDGHVQRAPARQVG